MAAEVQRTDAAGADIERELEHRLARLGERLELDRERRLEVLAELRSHVLDAVDALEARGLSREESLEAAWRNLGPEGRLVAEINAAHAGSDTVEGVLVAALPVLLALLLRGSVLTMDGTWTEWPRLAHGLPFGLFAAVALIAPIVAASRRRYALASWSAFWALTVLFLIGS